MSVKESDPITISMGPHHPSMHGVLRLIVTLDGENVVDCEPVLGCWASILVCDATGFLLVGISSCIGHF